MSLLVILFFFFNDTATTETYTLSLHDALPISSAGSATAEPTGTVLTLCIGWRRRPRSAEHTSELQSRRDIVCRLLLETKNAQLHPPAPQYTKETPQQNVTSSGLY